MLTDKAACSRKWIILADQSNGIRITSFSYKSYVTRNIYMSRTQRYTRNWLTICTCTTSIFNMFHIIITISDQSFINRVCRLVTNGTICGFHDRQRGLLHNIQCFHCCISIKYIFNKSIQLSKSNTTWYTFSTSLCMTQLQKCSCHINRA